MKKRLFLIIAAMFTVSFSAFAQYDDEYEIVVTDANGRQQEIDIPEAMTLEVDSLLNLYYSKNFIEDDGNCTTSSSDPEFSDQEYIDRLNRLPYVVPMPYNEIVRKFIDRYTKTGRRSVGYMIAAMNFYTPIFEQALETFVSDKEVYQRALDSYLESEDYRKYEYTYEHLLVYYTFRYFPRAAYDYNLPEKARFAVFCTLVIRDLDAMRYAERGEFTFTDRIDTVKDFSKQVEHSDYNIDYLMEELLFL